jgi:hypothetical protein
MNDCSLVGCAIIRTTMNNFETSPSLPPYVISADVTGLMGQWADAEGYDVPSDAYFADLTSDAGRDIGHYTGLEVDIVPEDEMRRGLSSLIGVNPNSVVSLDRAYLDESNPNVSGFIDVTRAVRETSSSDWRRPNFVGVGVSSPRPGFPPLDEQLRSLRTGKIEPVTLVDDVIFSGEGAVDLAGKLREIGRPVERIIAGIGIAAGLAKIKLEGIDVECVRTYKDVTDEVCERDFVAGVPMSGRTVQGNHGEHWSAPYFMPYGNPESWASIPDDKCLAFSRSCLDRSIDMWSEVERISRRVVPAAAAPRPLKGASMSESITTQLKRHREQM